MKTPQELEALAAGNPAQLAEELLENQQLLLNALVLVQLQQEQRVPSARVSEGSME